MRLLRGHLNVVPRAQFPASVETCLDWQIGHWLALGVLGGLGAARHQSDGALVDRAHVGAARQFLYRWQEPRDELSKLSAMAAPDGALGRQAELGINVPHRCAVA